MNKSIKLKYIIIYLAIATFMLTAYIGFRLTTAKVTTDFCREYASVAKDSLASSSDPETAKSNALVGISDLTSQYVKDYYSITAIELVAGLFVIAFIIAAILFAIRCAYRKDPHDTGGEEWKTEKDQTRSSASLGTSL